MKNLALLLSLAAACVGARADGPDWMFARGDYTHSPVTGERVVQYAAAPPVEGLPDPRDITSRYAQNQTVLRGVNGSTQSIIEVQSFGSRRGGFEAQAERAFDASLEQLRALEPFRRNPWLFYGSAVGPGGFGAGGVPGFAAPGAGVPSGAVPSGGFPPFGVPTQPWGGVGPYLPAYGPFFGGPFYGGGFYGGYPVPHPVAPGGLPLPTPADGA